MTTKAEQLIQIAKTRFDLSVSKHGSECKLLRQVIKGEDADYRDLQLNTIPIIWLLIRQYNCMSGMLILHESDALNDPAIASEWDSIRTLRASLIVWLCTAPEPRLFVTHCGLSIKGARIEGSLNLELARLDFPLIFHRCAFTDLIRLDQAQLKFLDLSGSYIDSSQTSDVSKKFFLSSLQANGMQVDGNVLLHNGFHATAQVSLVGAIIGGNLHCEKGTFLGSEGIALLAENIEVKGNVLLSSGFHATGQVSLMEAIIGGSLYCNDGYFDYSKEEYVLIIQSAEIKGSFLLRNSIVKGTVWLMRAIISGALECSGTFYGANEIALQADSSKIKGSVSLKNIYMSGAVELTGANIGGNFTCDSGEFSGSGTKPALILQGAEIKGCFFLHKSLVNGILWLIRITIGVNFECHNSRIYGFNGDAIVVENAEIKGAFTVINSYVNGTLSLLGTSIDSDLKCEQGVFENPEGSAIVAKNAQVKGDFFLFDSHVNGTVFLVGATIDGRFACENSSFYGFEKIAINALSSDIGTVLLSNGFRGRGEVLFYNATIKDTLYMEHKLPLTFAKFALKLFSINSLAGILFWQHFNSLILDLQFTTTRTLEDSEESWPQSGSLKLNGFNYKKISSNSPITSDQRLKWLRLQNQETFFPQPYEQLAQVLQTSGHEQAATEVLIGKQEDRRHYGNLNCISWWWNWFLGFFIDHGYHPYKALLFALVFVTLGTRLFSWGYSQNLISPSHIETFESPPTSASRQVAEDYPKFNPLIYSLDVFIPIMDLHQQNYWLPNANRGTEVPLLLFRCTTGSLLRWYFWIHIVWGWILTSLWVAGFTGLVRRVE